MSRLTRVHWLFKDESGRGLTEEAVAAEQHLCDVPSSARNAEHSVVLRPIIRQKAGGRLRECERCAAIGKVLRIP